jgi:hypothetical protein
LLPSKYTGWGFIWVGKNEGLVGAFIRLGKNIKKTLAFACLFGRRYITFAGVFNTGRKRRGLGTKKNFAKDLHVPNLRRIFALH